MPYKLENAKILIVDDDDSLNRSLASILGAEGYRISSRQTAVDLLDVLDGDQVDLLILDIGLPGVDGLSALDTVKRHPIHRDVPILVLSGAPPGEASVEALGLGEAPVLEHKGKRFTQSGVILTYLSRLSGKFKAQSEDDELEVLRWILFDNHKVTNFMATPSYASRLRLGARGRAGGAPGLIRCRRLVG